MSSLCLLRSRKFLKLRCFVGDPNIRGGDAALARYAARLLPELVFTGIEPSPSDSELDRLPTKPAGDAKNDVLDADRPCRGLRKTEEEPADRFPEGGFPRSPAGGTGCVVRPCVTLDALCNGRRVPPFVPFAPSAPSANPRNESPEESESREVSPPTGFEPGTAERHGSRSPTATPPSRSPPPTVVRSCPPFTPVTGSIAGNPARGGFGG